MTNYFFLIFLDPPFQALFIGNAILSVALVFSTIFLLISAFRNKQPMFLVPWLIVSIITIVVGIGATLYFGIAFALEGITSLAIIFFFVLLLFSKLLRTILLPIHILSLVTSSIKCYFYF